MAQKPIFIDELDKGLEDKKPKTARQVPVFSMSEPFWWAMGSLGAMVTAFAFVLYVSRA